jgi:predicted ABC-type transport system involved in lysophospholipase L1 biosynthesis ATPase subunit
MLQSHVSDLAGELAKKLCTRAGGRLCFGFVFQAFHLFPFLTAQENVEMALRLRKAPRQTRKTRAMELLTRCGLEKRMSFYPGSLGGGEKQRVAIARALAGDPQILLADEPSFADRVYNLTDGRISVAE